MQCDERTLINKRFVIYQEKCQILLVPASHSGRWETFKHFIDRMNNIYQYVHDNNNQYRPILSLSDFFSASLLVFILKNSFLWVFVAE